MNIIPIYVSQAFVRPYLVFSENCFTRNHQCGQLLFDSNHISICFSNTIPSIFCHLTAGHYYASAFSLSLVFPVIISIPIYHGTSCHLISCQNPTVLCLIVFLKPCLGVKIFSLWSIQESVSPPQPCLVTGCWVLLEKSDNLTPLWIHNQKPQIGLLAKPKTQWATLFSHFP